MKSLIQNDLQFGEKLQTTEASNFNENHQKKHQNNNRCLMLFSHCFFLCTSYNRSHQISIKNFKHIAEMLKRIDGKTGEIQKKIVKTSDF